MSRAHRRPPFVALRRGRLSDVAVLVALEQAVFRPIFCRGEVFAISLPRDGRRSLWRKRTTGSPAMCLSSIRRAPRSPGSIRSPSRRISAGAASARSFWPRRRKRRAAGAAAPCVLRCTSTTPERLHATRNPATGFSAGIPTIMTTAPMPCASRSGCAHNRATTLGDPAMASCCRLRIGFDGGHRRPPGRQSLFFHL